MGPSSGGQFAPNAPVSSRVAQTSARPAPQSSSPDNLVFLEQQLRGQAQNGDPNAVNQLMQLEWMKFMQNSRGRGSGGRGGGDSDESDTEFPQRDGGLKGLDRMRKRFHSHPAGITETYMSKVLQNLGVTDPRQVWQLKDFSKKIRPQFGRMTGIWRCHHATSEILQMLVDGHVEHATALTVQLLKAQHQAAINQGSWEIAAMLLPTEDPLSRVEFGGDHEEMKRIQSWRRGMRDLRTSVARAPGQDVDEEPETVGNKKKKKGGKGKGKEEDGK